MLVIPFLALMAYTTHVIYENNSPDSLSDDTLIVLEQANYHPLCEDYLVTNQEPLRKCEVSYRPKITCYTGTEFGVMCVEEISY